MNKSSKIAFSHAHLCYMLATEHLWWLLMSASPLEPIVDTRANVSLCPFTAYQTLLLGSTRSFLRLTNVLLKHRYVCFHCSIFLYSFMDFQVERV